MSKTSALQLFNAGYTELVCVTPPAANLSANSTIKPQDCGKAPGLKAHGRDEWFGYSFVKEPGSRKIAAQIDEWSANTGIHAALLPAVDIDCSEPALAELIEQVARQVLGEAPMRIGRQPKRLLVYRASEPFRKVVVHLLKDGEPQPAEGAKPQRLIEVLGKGFQYVVAGVHPVTGKDYQWVGRPLHEWDRDRELALITPEKVAAFFAAVQEAIKPLGYAVGRASSAKRVDCVNQHSLKAPSVDTLRTVVGLIPNTNDLFPARDDMIQMAYAIKGAGQDDPAAALQVFLDWGMRWEGNGLFPANDPEELEREWSKCSPPFRTGWPWLAKIARGQGWSDAGDDFADTVLMLPPPSDAVMSPASATEPDWGVPQPLSLQVEPAPYPVDAPPPTFGGWQRHQELGGPCDLPHERSGARLARRATVPVS